MCGIFGIWHRDGRPVDILALSRATTLLRHRGPDDEGYLLVDTSPGRAVLCGGENTAPALRLPRIEELAGERFDLALGFRRLSILDLSPAGHQPMPSRDGKCWLIFNGEVYNYVELRQELAALGREFHTGTDSEVILAAYQEWGPECLSRFNGMWALAIWDTEKRRLFLARDRFGVKPLYVVEDGGTFAFGSEIKALLSAGVVAFKPSSVAVAAYVAQGRSPSHIRGETFFEGVRSLPAAHYALISREGTVYRRYWSLPAEGRRQKAEGSSTQTALVRYSELFTDAVRLRLRADVPVGTCLSGGVDSSSIVAVAGRLMQTEHAVSLERLGEHQQTFSAVYDAEGPWNEREHIERVIERTGAAGNYIHPTPERLWADLQRLVWHQDEPFQSTSIFAQWCVMDLAHRRGVTVLLDGQGADEVLGGYHPYSVRLAELLRGGRLLSAIELAGDARRVAGANPASMLARALAVQLPAPLLKRLRGARVRQAAGASGLQSEVEAQLLDATQVEDEPYVDQRSLSRHLAKLLVEDSLPNLLRYEDRNSMAFSIEARVPFLDYRLVEHAFTQAAPLRIHKGWTKWVQRMAVRDLLPKEIVWRRDKVGFETPEAQWMKDGRQHIIDMLHADDTGSEYLDLAAVRRQAPALLDRPGGPAQVWRWLNLVVWLRCFADEGR
ncbi:MAG TPA: asparagine synthase (glutamine-hydrolyzing) [Chloroflexia bacterium]|nr:asparagine synthase (glutamine-hydrolyzing) [Chloroflexia bacterium]